MNIRVLPDDLINQIAAGEVVERPASVVKELIENALDAGADQIVIDVTDGGRTLISIVDNGRGMSHIDLGKSILRHATSKLPDDDLLNICFMGFRGEALPSIASVSDMTIDTRKSSECRVQSSDNNENKLNSELCTLNSGLSLNCTTGEIKPSAWESGTRVRVENLFRKTPARLKFLRSDRAEMMSIVEIVKRLALSRPDVGFTLNDKWRFPKGQPLQERIIAVMGEDVRDRMIEIGETGNRKQETGGLSQNKPLSKTNNNSFTGDESSCLLSHVSCLSLTGFISEPTLRRASSIDQYLFVNGRPVRDKVLIGALRAAYMDVMNAREFPLCALYLTVPPHEVDVNVSPAKTEVHFLEPSKVRAFIIRKIRDALTAPMTRTSSNYSPLGESRRDEIASVGGHGMESLSPHRLGYASPAPPRGGAVVQYPCIREPERGRGFGFWDGPEIETRNSKLEIRKYESESRIPSFESRFPLGRVIGQIGNKYIAAENSAGLVIVDQHAAHERIVYEKLRKREIKRQPLLTPIVIKLKPEEVTAVMEVEKELESCGLKVSEFGDDAVAIYEKPADWNLDWTAVLRSVADEVRAHGHSSNLSERLHLKLANYACHHSVRAGQRLDPAQMDALLRDVENTERAGQCNHGRPVYRIIPLSELDGWFERI